MLFLIIGFGLIGAIIGTWFFQFPGMVFGFAIGLLAAWGKILSNRITSLKKRLDAVEGLTSDTRMKAKAAETDHSRVKKHEPVSAAEPPKAPEKTSASRPDLDIPDTDSSRNFPEDSFSSPDTLEQVFAVPRDFFTKGNTVVRMGLIVLFFGVAFLIKYAAERNLISIELRLAAVALAGVLMLLFGWRIRDRRPTYALLIQGGAVGILYLTIFGAARLYHLLPIGLAFALMIGMVVLSAMLALIQDAVAMAVFGTIGGFLAPILISPGTGSHVILFSYYALINTGIVGIAWFKSWRTLNWIGFVFTFGIGLTWGYRFYRPEFFQTTEPFLILFFLFYLSISVLFAYRQPVHLKGYIDGTLVFGLPLVAFGLQSAVVYEYAYGMTISSLVMGGLYITLASMLWQRRIEGMRLLTESFLALGVVFASISIPLGLDSNWTTALWCLEGAGLVWIGVRQHRILARSAGLLLQIGAAVSFLVSYQTQAINLPVLNSTYMGSFLISLSGFISGYCYMRYTSLLKNPEQQLHIYILVWAFIWWFFGGLHEIDYHLAYTDKVFAAVLFIAASGWVFGMISRRIQWAGLAYPAMAVVPVAAVIALAQFNGPLVHPFAGWGAAAWSVAVLSGCHLLYRFDQKWSNQVLRGLHTILLIFIIFLLTWESAWVTGLLVSGKGTWSFAVWGLFPAIAVVLLLRYGVRISWPVMQYKTQYLGEGLIPVTLFMLGWIITACFKASDPEPLAYLPLINPVEMIQIFALWTLIRWQTGLEHHPSGIMAELPPHSMVWLMLGAAFLWLNSVIARTVHFWTGVDFSGSALFDSVYFQSALSIGWSLTALALMAAAARRKSRPPWVIGAALLGVVVAKLFLVDLAGIGTVARIVTFIAVGILMLAIGYISPLPPKQMEDTA